MIGRTIAHFRVIEKLGEGGMGVVWKATDTHLDRPVALKILPPDKLASPERRLRFVREAKAASALNHPNIVAVYDVDSADGVDYIAMEYVEGRTLDRLIPRNGLPPAELLHLAVQIADALARAHAAGIVHRDLKPSNLIAGADGRLRILDFGLAKLSEPAERAGDTEGRTLVTADAPDTEEGTILGTSGYMSPEQAQGKPVDSRSDIFSFGAVLYEMAAGRRAFRGDTRAAVLAAILHQEPEPPRSLVEDLPPELERIILRCLRKDPGRRYQSTEDLRIALLELKEESDSGKMRPPEGASAARRRPALLWPSIAAVAALFALLAVWQGIPFSKPDPDAAPPVPEPLTSYVGREHEPDFSPDGNRVVFSWNGASEDNWDIYVKLIGDATVQRLTTHPATDSSPSWSPDGRLVAFVRAESESAELVLLPSIGGPERVVTSLAMFNPLSFSARIRWGIDWCADSMHLIVSDRENANDPLALYLVSLAGEKRRLTSPPPNINGDRSPRVSPDGRRIAFDRLYSAGESSVLQMHVTEDFAPVGEPRKLTTSEYAHSPVWTADGKEILYSEGPVERTQLRRISASGGPSRPIEYAQDAMETAVSLSGNRMVFVRRRLNDDIWEVDLPDGSNPRRLLSSTYRDLTPQYSPDGRRIAFSSGRSGYREIWVCDRDGSNPVQLTELRSVQSSAPSWSPDGREIVFQSVVENQREIFVVRASGGAPRRLTNDPAIDLEPTWSRDGKWIYFGSFRGGAKRIWKVPAEGGTPVAVTDGISGAIESRVGRILYVHKSSPRSLWSFSQGGHEVRLFGSVHPQSLNTTLGLDGLYYLPDGPDSEHRWWLWRYSFASGKTEAVFRVSVIPSIGLSVAPDGKSLLFSGWTEDTADLMLVENFR